MQLPVLPEELKAMAQALATAKPHGQVEIDTYRRNLETYKAACQERGIGEQQAILALQTLRQQQRGATVP